MLTNNTKPDDQEKIQGWVSELRLSPQIGDTAFEILQTWKKHFSTIYNVERQNLLAASLYVAIKADPMCAGLTLHDFLSVTKVSKKYVLRRYRKMVLDMEVTPQACSMKPGPYLDALLMKVDADERLKARAVEILAEEMSQVSKNYSGNPTAVAGAVLYIAALIERDWMPLHRVADLVGINKQTVSNYVYLMKGQSAILARGIMKGQSAILAQDKT